MQIRSMIQLWNPGEIKKCKNYFKKKKVILNAVMAVQSFRMGQSSSSKVGLLQGFGWEFLIQKWISSIRKYLLHSFKLRNFAKCSWSKTRQIFFWIITAQESSSKKRLVVYVLRTPAFFGNLKANDYPWSVLIFKCFCYYFCYGKQFHMNTE